MSDVVPSTAEPTATAKSIALRWKPLRIWPPILLLALMVLFRFLPQIIEDGPTNIWMSAAFGPLLCGLFVFVWWNVASRATWQERLVGFFGVIAALMVSVMFMDISMLGPAIMVLTIPMGTAAFAIGAICCSRMLSFRRTIVALLCATLGISFSTLVRCDGMWGNFALGLHWRWKPSSEDVLQKVAVRPPVEESTQIQTASEDFEALNHPQCPGFRGPERDGRYHGAMIATDWTSSPPELIWKVPVGPAWSSFAVAGNRLFTQEQRGPQETVVCYAADTGREIWTRQVESRFDDPLGGPGPRATPTLADGALYAMFATGTLMRLDPHNGNIVWQQDVKKVAERAAPMWGFSSSPLVVNNRVIVHAGGAGNKGVLAFDTGTGTLALSVAAGDDSYSSPQLATVLGEQAVLMLTNAGLQILDPLTLAERLNYSWVFKGYRALQPQVIGQDSVILPTTLGAGTRRIRVARNDDQWKADEVWTSRNFKPDFNDFVIYQGHAYGFDQAMFTCIDLETGNRKWKGGRYGKGQVLLIEDAGLLLVIGEQGDLNLLKADPKAHVELAKFQAIEGKTWNHPVLIGDQLYIRNSQEAARYRLPVAAN